MRGGNGLFLCDEVFHTRTTPGDVRDDGIELVEQRPASRLQQFWQELLWASYRTFWCVFVWVNGVEGVVALRQRLLGVRNPEGGVHLRVKRVHYAWYACFFPLCNAHGTVAATR